MNSLISVIVPVYKVEEFLPVCVDSILAQTYGNFELFLVDDGSPDSCGEICERYAEKDSRITVIHKENGGLSDARNVAIDQMNGEYVTFIDSDDYVSKDYLEKLLYCAQKYDADIVQCDFTKDPQTLGQPTAPGQKAITLIYDEDILRDYLRLGVPKVFACGKLYKSGLFQDVRYPFGLIDEDNYTTFKLMYGIHVFININRQMYYYRTNMESITNMAFSERKFGILKSPDAIREFLKDKTTEYNDDVDYYDMRQNIQLYNNAVQANAEDQFAVQLKPVYDKLMNYKDKHIGIDLKYRMMLQLLKQSKPLYKKLIQTLR